MAGFKPRKKLPPNPGRTRTRCRSFRKLRRIHGNPFHLFHEKDARAMKRHPSLHPLSQHHHFALIQALEMRRAAESPAERRGAAVQRQAEKFVRFWHKTGQVHFREEEEVLLPAYARITRLDRDPEVMRLLADHAEIRAAVLDFEQRLAAKTAIEA